MQIQKKPDASTLRASHPACPYGHLDRNGMSIRFVYITRVDTDRFGSVSLRLNQIVICSTCVAFNRHKKRPENCQSAIFRSSPHKHIESRATKTCCFRSIDLRKANFKSTTSFIGQSLGRALSHVKSQRKISLIG